MDKSGVTVARVGVVHTCPHVVHTYPQVIHCRFLFIKCLLMLRYGKIFTCSALAQGEGLPSGHGKRSDQFCSPIQRFYTKSTNDSTRWCAVEFVLVHLNPLLIMITAQQVFKAAKLVLTWLSIIGRNRRGRRNRMETRDLVIYICACRTLNIPFSEIAKPVRLSLRTCIHHYNYSKYLKLPDHRLRVQQVIDKINLEPEPIYEE